MTADDLRDLIVRLEHYADPDNREGFFRHFCFWVSRTWTTEKACTVDVKDSGCDYDTFGRETSSPLSEVALSYAEFINSPNGQTDATFESGLGFRAQTRDTDLYEEYGEACAAVIRQFIFDKNLVLEETKVNEYRETVWDAIWGEDFDDEEMDILATDIVCRFGVLGRDLEPYQCEFEFRELPDGTIEEKVPQTQISEWTLSDFKRVITV